MARMHRTRYNNQHAGVVELVDTRDLKSREGLSRTGSIPVSGMSKSPDYIRAFWY